MPFKVKSFLMLLEFSSKGHSWQSTATLSVGPCVCVRLGRPKLSASEVTCQSFTRQQQITMCALLIRTLHLSIFCVMHLL